MNQKRRTSDVWYRNSGLQTVIHGIMTAAVVGLAAAVWTGAADIASLKAVVMEVKVAVGGLDERVRWLERYRLNLRTGEER